MNIVFIIGNGFDLNLGLKTKYTDVYEHYCEDNPKDSSLIKQFKRDITSDYENWSDFEMAMADYGRYFSSENEFIACIRDFQSFMSLYIEDEEQRIIDVIRGHNPSINYRDLLYSRFSRFGNSLFPEEKRATGIAFQIASDFKYSVINFNYTNTLSFMHNMVHVHGSISNNDLILGVDSIEQLQSLPYHISSRGERQFVKPIFNKLYDSQRVTAARNYIEGAKIICIYGASLGDSDLTWREMIINWLKERSDRHLIIYDYELFHYPINIMKTEKMDIEEDRKEKLKLEWRQHDIPEQIINNQVHFPVGYNLFDFSDIINFEQEL